LLLQFRCHQIRHKQISLLVICIGREGVVRDVGVVVVVVVGGGGGSGGGGGVVVVIVRDLRWRCCVPSFSFRFESNTIFATDI